MDGTPLTYPHPNSSQSTSNELGRAGTIPGVRWRTMRLDARGALRRASWLIAGVMVLGLLAGPSASSSQAQPVTATPTPRVIRVGRPRGTPSLAASPQTAATATPTPFLEIEGETGDEMTPTPTPFLEIEDETPAVSLPTAVPSSTLTTPTATPTEPTLPTRTATPVPPPTVTPMPAPQTIAPANPATRPTLAPIAATRIEFTAEDWAGGFYRGDRLAYGRPWVAVYGAFSDYPRASLRLPLEARPRGEATLTIVGLDDEWAGSNQIALEINDEIVYSGSSPFASWDGVGDGRDAAWTAVAFTLPEGLLRRGENDVAIANLAPVASFNSPPYVLLSTAALELASGRADG